jgi:hypothetical protein
VHHTIGSTTLLFLSVYLAECLGHFEFKTLLSLSSVFCMSRFFLCKDIQLAVCAESAQARVLETRNFASAKFFLSHHASGLVSMSSTKIFFQETHAEYHTLAARQDEYHPQDS